MNVAQLKRLSRLRSLRQESRSHVRMNVAQLKRQTRSAAPLQTGAFPRSNERGSIEAPQALPSHTCCLRFPRSNERGSIEALPGRRGRGWRFRRSHVRMSVAQLKPVDTNLADGSILAFPRSNERGSIEAERLAEVEALVD